MLDLNLNLTIDTEQLTNLLGSKTSSNSSGAFAKVLESANKSFQASQNALSTKGTINTAKNEGIYFLNTKNEETKQDMFASAPQACENNNTLRENNIKEENTSTSSTQEQNKAQRQDETQEHEVTQKQDENQNQEEAKIQDESNAQEQEKAQQETTTEEKASQEQEVISEKIVVQEPTETPKEETPKQEKISDNEGVQEKITTPEDKQSQETIQILEEAETAIVNEMQLACELQTAEVTEVATSSITPEKDVTVDNNSSKNTDTNTVKEIVSEELPTTNENTEIKLSDNKTQQQATTTTTKHSSTKSSDKNTTEFPTDEPTDTTQNDTLTVSDTTLDVQDDSQIETPLTQSNNNIDVIVKGDVISNLESEIKANTNKTNTSFADSIEEIDVDAKIEVTAVQFSDTANISDKNYNFNSSAFSDLSNHITKISLNKTADFSKVMNEKATQETQILNQVKEATANTLAKGTSKVSIILRPENLGRVNVNLASNNGVLTAQFVAQNQQAADALNKNLETLRQNLIDQGVKVNDITVKVQETSQSNNFADNHNFTDDKLNEFKESNSSKNSFKGKNSNENLNKNENAEEPTYFSNNEQNTENENETTNKIVNKELEIYNNMGRKL